ncbi:glycoside hydrolase family 76 protein [Arthrobacter sp. H5]|uniref:glycoside hydrolase family 76 protein n=1 Tax=Arthrobacter sp. H5 TaxID=1267973 RepID=UPI0004860EAF|nr:glycoside hydrolase family 76 protein [Arthrobacter sp. H5]
MLTPPNVRARLASESVTTAFGRGLLGLPGTQLASTALPGAPGGGWHYWWQAHYLDCLVDAAARKDGDDDGAHRRRARRLLRGIWLRNGFRWTNSYYDDMAWLALAAARLGSAPASLGRALESAHTADLGGGLFWNTARDFKNTPATAPAALFFARHGQRDRAQQLVEWLYARLWDAESGLFLDGIRLRDGREVVERTIYSYNQGPVLGALLSLGGEQNLRRAADLVGAVSDGLTLPGGALRTHGAGDGGLFTGILARYLALAAGADLPDSVRGTARSMITTTADALWAGRTERTLDINPGWTPARMLAGAGTRPGSRRRTFLVFPSSAEDVTEYPTAAGTVQLSTQLQAWMIFEAAARVS